MPQRKRSHPPDANVPDIPPLPDGTSPTSVEGVTRLFLKRTADAIRKLALWSGDNYGALPIPHASTHLESGSDPLDTSAPLHVGLANTAGSPSVGTADDFSRSDHDHGDIKREVEVQSGGVLVGVRRLLNIVGATVADNPGSDRVDVTIPSPASIVTTPGDIIVRDGTTAVRKAVGSQHDLLEVETANADKLQYSSLATILARLLTTQGDLVATDGSGPTRHALPAGEVGHALWNDQRVGDRIGGGALGQSGHAYRGLWYRSNGDAGPDSMTSGVAVALFDAAAFGALDALSLTLEYMAYYDDATDIQAETGQLSVLVLRKGSTWQAATATPHDINNGATAGALTVTFTVDPGHDKSGAVDATKVTLKTTLTSAGLGALNYMALQYRVWCGSNHTLSFVEP